MGDEPKMTEVGTKEDDLAVLKQQMSQLVGIVSQQQETFKRLQEVGLRTSDAAAVRDEGLEAHIKMGPSGFVVALNGAWTMGHINQVRLAMRQQMLLDATRMKMASQQAGLAHRVTGKVAQLGEGEIQ